MALVHKSQLCGQQKRENFDILGHVVGSMTERRRGCSHDLQKRVHVLGPVVVVFGMSVDGFNVPRQDVAFLLKTDNVLVHAMEHDTLEVPEQDRWSEYTPSRPRAYDG